MKNIVFIFAFLMCICFVHALNSNRDCYAPAYLDLVMCDTFDLNTYNRLPDNIADACIHPLPGAKLNYTQIMFEHPQVTGAQQYILEVAPYEDGDQFEHSVLRQEDSSTAAMISNFEFGHRYTWRYTGVLNGKQLDWKGPYNFEILNNGIDKTRYRVRVIKNDTAANTAGLIMLDMSACVDRNGNFVWFLPPAGDEKPSEKLSITPAVIQDLRLTPFGTITLINGLGLAGARPEERDLNGRILWKAPEHNAYYDNPPSKERKYNYHHCFKRLANGNYVVLDKDIAQKKTRKITNVALLTGGAATDTEQIAIAYETIRELNKEGKTIWSWNSENYFDSAELSRPAMQEADPVLRSKIPGGHLNAFDVDEKNGFVYAGFRNANRVIKIDKKTGQVVYACGDDVLYKGAFNGNGFFSKQHGTTVLKDGSVAVFNNGSANSANQSNGAASAVKIFTSPDVISNSRLVWQFNCTFDSVNYKSNTGGNVDELKNGNLLVCMGDVNRVFEITRKKQIVWNALIETYNENDINWHPFPIYRAHYTSSLYPCYFSAQTNCDTLFNEQTRFGLKIFNDGSEDDSYYVNISSGSGAYNHQFSTAVLRPKKAGSFKISPGKLPLKSEPIKVTIISKTNPDFTRTMYVQYNK